MFNKERVKGLVTGALIGAIITGTVGVFLRILTTSRRCITTLKSS